MVSLYMGTERVKALVVEDIDIVTTEKECQASLVDFPTSITIDDKIE
jgi:hypothetical protein